jgi:hypothetical protein
MFWTDRPEYRNDAGPMEDITEVRYASPADKITL